MSPDTKKTKNKERTDRVRNSRVRHQLAVTLRDYLRQREWSETEFARRTHVPGRVGVSQKQVNNIIRERYGCSIEAAEEMAQTIGVPLYQMLIWGRSSVTAVTPRALDKVIHAYLSTSADFRSQFDSLAERAVK